MDPTRRPWAQGAEHTHGVLLIGGVGPDLSRDTVSWATRMSAIRTMAHIGRPEGACLCVRDRARARNREQRDARATRVLHHVREVSWGYARVAATENYVREAQTCQENLGRRTTGTNRTKRTKPPRRWPGDESTHAGLGTDGIIINVTVRRPKSPAVAAHR
jgi:hypothetical protein